MQQPKSIQGVIVDTARPTREQRIQALQAATGWQANKIKEALEADPLTAWLETHCAQLRQENAELRDKFFSGAGDVEIKHEVIRILDEALSEPTSERFMKNMIEQAKLVLKGKYRKR